MAAGNVQIPIKDAAGTTRNMTFWSDNGTVTGNLYPAQPAQAAAIPAGANLIGKVGIDQTTPGTTNGVALIPGQNGVAGNTGTVGATTQRVVLATDVALPAGEAHIGAVGGSPILVVSQTPTVTASSAYAAGNVIGALMTFAAITRGNDITAILQMVEVTCKTSQTGAMDLLLFNVNPSNSTFTDKSALAVNTADLPGLVGIVHLTDWTSLGTPSVAQALNLALPFKPLSGGTTLYGVLVARGTPTYGSTSDIVVTLKSLPN